MHKILHTLTIFLLLSSTIELSAQEVDYDQLERRQKVAYLKGKDVPFTGKAFGYYKSGTKSKEVNFVDGLKEGVYKTWYESGNKESVKFYKANKMEGAIISWYENGNYERKVEFKQDKKHGKFQSFYESGKLKADGSYINDKKTGIHIGYYENGKMESKGEFVDGAENGLHTEWYESGVKCKEIVYDNGVIKSERYWDTTGKELSKEEIQKQKQLQQNGNLMQMWMQQQ